MRISRWILPILCTTAALQAQSLADLNSLISTASRYVHQGLTGTMQSSPLELCKVIGDTGQPNELMNRSVDVLHWKFLYRIDITSEVAYDERTRHSVIAECTRGVFGGFKFSTDLITDTKTLENTWIALPLADAIDSLHARGYIRGFSRVTLARPTNPSVPDEYVYVFDCPVEGAQVAISTQTGDLTWIAPY